MSDDERLAVLRKELHDACAERQRLFHHGKAFQTRYRAHRVGDLIRLLRVEIALLEDKRP
jgi:hypothetical protein